MIQLVKPQTEGKQEQVKRVEKQMEAMSRWKRERQRQFKGARREEKETPPHKREKHHTICPMIIEATWEQYKAIKSFEKTIGNSMVVPFSIKF